MTEYYIRVKDIEEDLKNKIKTIENTIEDYKNAVNKIGTVEDGGQFGFKIACEYMLNKITRSNLMSHAQVLITTEEITKENGDTEILKTVSRTDVLYQLRQYAKEHCDFFKDYMKVYEVIDAFLVELGAGENE